MRNSRSFLVNKYGLLVRRYCKGSCNSVFLKKIEKKNLLFEKYSIIFIIVQIEIQKKGVRNYEQIPL